MARRHPLPALGGRGALAAELRVLTLLGGGRAQCGVHDVQRGDAGCVYEEGVSSSGDGARVCPPSTPHQLARVDVSSHAANSPSLCAGRTASADTGKREVKR